nr:14299_t:CDS:1 [Entrophospora candida]
MGYNECNIPGAYDNNNYNDYNPNFNNSGQNTQYTSTDNWQGNIQQLSDTLNQLLYDLNQLLHPLQQQVIHYLNQLQHPLQQLQEILRPLLFYLQQNPLQQLLQQLQSISQPLLQYLQQGIEHPLQQLENDLRRMQAISQELLQHLRQQIPPQPSELDQISLQQQQEKELSLQSTQQPQQLSPCHQQPTQQLRFFEDYPQKFTLKEVAEFLRERITNPTDRFVFGDYIIIAKCDFNERNLTVQKRLEGGEETRGTIINEEENRHQYESESEIIKLKESNIELKSQLESKAVEMGKILESNEDLKNAIEELKGENKNLKKELKEKNDEMKEYNKMEEKYNKMEEKYNKMKIKLNESEKTQNKNNKDKQTNQWFSNNKNHDNKLKVLQSQCNTLESECQGFKENNDRLEKLLNLKDKEIDYLKEANEKLKKEAIKYQSALGDATSFHLGSQDPNSAGQLSKDIHDLHNNLVKFCGLRKADADVNISTVKELLRKFGCSLTVSNKISTTDKILISGALERHVIEMIIEKTKNYLKKVNEKDAKQDDENRQQSLEAKIVNTTEQLLELTNLIPTYRAGTDEVTKATSTKLRQQIYGVLGNRGFSNMVADGGKRHPLIVGLQKNILKSMDDYRTIKNPEEKLPEIKKLIDMIIRQVISIFFFRLKVQEPVAEYKFFTINTSINTKMMEAPLDENEIEDYCVNVCEFPIIGSNLCEADISDKDLKVIFPAQITTIKKSSVNLIVL